MSKQGDGYYPPDKYQILKINRSEDFGKPYAEYLAWPDNKYSVSGAVIGRI
jgi:hypothetical protein